MRANRWQSRNYNNGVLTCRKIQRFRNIKWLQVSWPVTYLSPHEIQSLDLTHPISLRNISIGEVFWHPIGTFSNPAHNEKHNEKEIWKVNIQQLTLLQQMTPKMGGTRVKVFDGRFYNYQTISLSTIVTKPNNYRYRYCK